MSFMSVRVLLVGLLLLGGSVQAQSPPTVVRQIRADFEAINRKVAGMKTVRRPLEGESTEGGEVVGHFDRAGTLRKMTATHYGEMGKHVQEIYLLPQGRVFALDTSIGYDQPGGKTVTTMYSRFYLDGGRLVRLQKEEVRKNDRPQSTGGFLVPVTDPDAKGRTRELLADIERYRALLSRPQR